MLVTVEIKVLFAPIRFISDLLKYFAIEMDALQVVLGAVITQEYDVEGKK